MHNVQVRAANSALAPRANFEYGASMARRERGSSVARPPPATVTVNEFDEVVQLIEEARRQATRAVNVKLIELYWKIGAVISRRIESDGWGKGTVQKLAAYLSRTQRGARGFSPQNLWRMRQFFEAYRDAPDLSKLVRELSWSANLYILGGTKRPEEREFYLRMAIKKGWNVRELARQIEAATFERSVLGSPKLSTALRQIHPEAAEDFKEVYSLEFLDLPDGHSEADLHGALRDVPGDGCDDAGARYPTTQKSASRSRRTSTSSRPRR